MKPNKMSCGEILVCFFSLLVHNRERAFPGFLDSSEKHGSIFYMDHPLGMKMRRILSINHYNVSWHEWLIITMIILPKIVLTEGGFSQCKESGCSHPIFLSLSNYCSPGPLIFFFYVYFWTRFFWFHNRIFTPLIICCS